MRRGTPVVDKVPGEGKLGWPQHLKPIAVTAVPKSQTEATSTDAGIQPELGYESL